MKDLEDLGGEIRGASGKVFDDHFALWQVQTCSLEFLKQIKVTIKDSSSSGGFIFISSLKIEKEKERNGRRERGDLSKMECC